MTYEKIQLKLRDAEQKDSESFDIFADNVDENVLASTSSKTQNIIEGNRAIVAVKLSPVISF